MSARLIYLENGLPITQLTVEPGGHYRFRCEVPPTPEQYRYLWYSGPGATWEYAETVDYEVGALNTLTISDAFVGPTYIRCTAVCPHTFTSTTQLVKLLR